MYGRCPRWKLNITFCLVLLYFVNDVFVSSLCLLFLVMDLPLRQCLTRDCAEVWCAVPPKAAATGEMNYLASNDTSKFESFRGTCGSNTWLNRDAVRPKP